MSRGFPLYTQHDVMDCGPTCLRMVAAYYGQHYSAEFLDHENRPQISCTNNNSHEPGDSGEHNIE